MSFLNIGFAQRFCHNGVEIHGFIDRFNATGGLESHGATGQFAVFADRLAHDERCFRRSCDRNLARGSLNVVRSGVHREDRGLLNVRGLLQFARLQDHFQRMFAANGLHFFDFIGAGFVIPALEGANREDHVDFVRTVFECKRRFGRLYLNEGLRSRETSADTSHANAVGLEVLAHRTREVRVNTDGSERRKVGMLVTPTVDTLRKPHHILVRIRNGQRGQLNSGEQSAENLRRVVLFAVIGHELTHRLRHLFVVEP